MLTVLMATYNGAKTLPEVLNAYCALTSPVGGWEVLIVDNGSTDETRKIIAEYQQRLPVVYCFEPKRGKNAALNATLPVATGDLIIFTDDDVIPVPQWLSEYRQAADSHPDLSVFCGPILPKWEIPPEDWILKWVPMGPAFAILRPSPEGPVPCRLAFGANIALRKKIFEQGYKFDETIGPNGTSYAQGSEVELTKRLARAGYRAWHCREAGVHHMIRSQQMSQQWILQRGKRYGRGQYRLAEKEASRVPALLGGVRVSLGVHIALYSLRIVFFWMARDKEKLFKARWALNCLIGKFSEAWMEKRNGSAPGSSLLQAYNPSLDGKKAVKLKVALFDPNSKGGIAHYSFHLAESLAKEGLDVDLFTSEGNDLEYLDRHFNMIYLYKQSSVKAFFNWCSSRIGGRRSGASASSDRSSLAERRINKGVLWRLRRWSRLLKAVCHLVLTRPAVVHFQWLADYKQDYLFIKILQRLGFKVFYTAHNVLPRNDESLGTKAFFKKLYRTVDRIIVHAESNKKELADRLQIERDKIVVIPHGSYDLLSGLETGSSKMKARRQLGVSEDDKVILFFGGMRRDKGLDLLLDVFPSIRAQVQGSLLLVAGKGGGKTSVARSYYVSLRRRLYEAEGVHFVEQYIPSEEVGVYFSAADAVILPYRKTYQSGVLLLAYAAGRPVVVTDTGGLGEVVENGKSGFVVSPGDVGALTEAVVAILQNQSRRDEMGRYAKHLGDTKYSWKSAAVQTIQEYCSLIGRSVPTSELQESERCVDL